MNRDRGAALIVAISFVLMIGAVTAGLSTLVTSGLDDRAVLEDVRNREYAADGAIEDAIAAVRAGIEAGSLTCSTAGGSSTTSMNAMTVRVDWAPSCSTGLRADGLAVLRRAVVFIACADVGAPCTDGAVIATAEVGFQQDDEGDVSLAVVQSWSVDR